MAKKSKIIREKKLLRNVQKFAQKRAELKSIIAIQILQLKKEMLR